MFFDECLVDPLGPLPIVLVPPLSLYDSPSLESRVLSISYWNSRSLAHRRSLYHHSFKGTHLGIHIERGKNNQLDTLVSSLEFHLAVPLISHTTSHPHSATFEPTLIHTRSRILKTNRPPIHSDSTVLLCSFCSIANAGFASSSNSSLYY